MALTMEQLNAIYEDALFSNTPPVNFKNMSVYENSVAPMEVNVPSGLQTIDIAQAPMVKPVTQSNGLDYLLNQGGEQNQNLTVEEYNNLIANQNAEPTDNFLTRALSGIADNKYVQNAKNITGMITQPLIGGIGFLASKMDKFSSLPYVDQQYVKENMVYKDPSSGLYKDPYGINVRSLGLLSDTDGSYGQYQVKEAEKLGENITKRAKEKYGVDFNVNEFLEKGDAYLETLSGKKVDKFKTLNKLNLEKLNFYGKGSAAFINQKDNYETAQKIKEADRKIRKAAAQQEIIRKAAAASRAESRRQYNPDVHGPNNYGLGSDGKQSFDTGQGFGSNATTGGPVSNRSGRGRTDFAFGGTGGRTSSSSDQGNKGGGGDRPSARERYLASLYSSKPITKTKTIAPPGEQGGQGYIAPTSKTRTVTTGGGSPFSYTKPPKTLSGITSNYINPTFRKATIDFLTRRQLANQPKSFLENLTSIYGDDVTTVASYGKDTKVEEAQARIEAGVAMPGDVDLVNAATNKITSVPDLSNPDVLNKIAIDTGMPTVKEGIYGMRKDVATPQTARDIKSIQNYKRNTDVDLRMSVPEIMRFDIGERLGQPQIQSIYDMVKVPGQTPFMAAQGGRVGYGTGGIVTL